MIFTYYFLAAGSPGFAVQWQLTPGGDAGKFVQAVAYFFVCEWKTAWTLLYKPINEDERDRINEIMKVFLIFLKFKSK